MCPTSLARAPCISIISSFMVSGMEGAGRLAGEEGKVEVGDDTSGEREREREIGERKEREREKQEKN